MMEDIEIKTKTADDYRLERNSLYHDLEAKSRELGTAKRKIEAMDLALRMAFWNIKVLQDGCMYHRPVIATIPLGTIQAVQEYQPPHIHDSQEG